jgi:hypothetical protein
MEQWYLSLLHEGMLPHALAGKPNTAFTEHLIEDAIKKVPRLRYELTTVSLRNFLTDQETLGVICTKYRAAIGNGWSFPLLAEARAAWAERYGPTKWDNDVEEWKKPGKLNGG